MPPPSPLLVLLLLAAAVAAARGSPVCNNPCCSLVEDFPARLRTLRLDYAQLRDYYEGNDDLDTALLDQTVEDSFRSPFGCYTMNSILDFYLRTVLPSAMAGVTEEIRSLKPHMESIHQIFDQLKADVTRCRHYFSCKKQFDVQNLNFTYAQMESKGLYKAMSELDLLFNYIETYLASKRRKSPTNAH